MRNVVTPLSRKRNPDAQRPSQHPRHRRDGYFDEQDQWHDSSEATVADTTQASS